MKHRPSLHIATLLLAASTAACVPLPVHVYAPDPSAGTVTYSSCTLDGSLPAGVKLPTPGFGTTVALDQGDAGGVLRVELDMPPGITLVLDDDVVRIDRGAALPAIEARIPNVSQVDVPGINHYGDEPAVRQPFLPVRSPLIGGRTSAGARSWDKRYWIGVRVDVQKAEDVTVSLPGFTINGTPAQFPPAHFHRQQMVAIASFNC
jgi:hypothetical protein